MAGAPPSSSAPTGLSPPEPGGKKTAKRRLDHIDAMRPIKQAGVVSTHTLLFFAPGASLVVGGALMLLHVTREAFLFVSACMLTYSYFAIRRSDYPRFYRRRCVSVLIPYLCWTAIYFFLTLHDGSYSLWTGFGHFWYLVATGYYQLYYLLVIMQFYVFFPLLLALLRKTKGHHVALLVVSAAVQITFVSLMHWKVLPSQMQGFWGSREVISYQFYLVAGMVVALHLDVVHDWIYQHWRVILLATVGAALVSEAWYILAVHHVAAWLGSGSDPLQPIVLPFNVGAIACIYLVGVFLVDRRRSTTVRAMIRSSSDNSYGVYLAQMVFITALTAIGWRHLDNYLPWAIVCVVTVALVFLACVLLTSLLARTPLSVPLTGRQRQRWDTWLPAPWRPAVAEVPSVPTTGWTHRGAAPAPDGETVVASPLDLDPQAENGREATSATAPSPAVG